MNKRKNIIKISLLISTALLSSLFYKIKTTAYDANRFVKTDVSVSDNAVYTFGTLYDACIPAGVKVAFESDGGMFYITPGTTAVTNGTWSSGNVITGTTKITSGVPAIYLSAVTVDQAGAYKANTARKVITHEMGHYVHAKANKLKNGKFSYNQTAEFTQAFQLEYGNIKKAQLSDVLKSSFINARGIDEYYANIFAGLVTEPTGTMAAFPMSSTLVGTDMNIINSYYGY